MTAIVSAEVVVSIKPLHSLVAGVMGDTDKPALLVSRNISPHDFQLKPSDISTLRNARIIFYIDRNFEFFLDRALGTLTNKTRLVEITSLAKLEVLSDRAEQAWAHAKSKFPTQPHKHGHNRTKNDMHVWLDTENARQIVRLIAKELSGVYPGKRHIYTANMHKFIDKIDLLDIEIKKELHAVKKEPFIVLHDAYQYFEHAYGLSNSSSILSNTGESVSAKHLQMIRARLVEDGISCVFREPQFSSRLLETAIEGQQARVGILDPVGSNLIPGGNLYIIMMRNLAKALKQCLALKSTTI